MPFYKKFLSVIMLIATAFSAVFSIYCVLPNKTNKPFNFTQSSYSFINNKQSFNNYSSNKSTVSKEKVGSQKAVTAASKGKVLGKISTEVLSPYTANLSYGKIYIKNQTGVNVNIKEELKKPITFKINKTKEPEVLIFSTHTTESYMLEDRDYYTNKDSTGTTDKTKNVVKIGSIIKENLEKNRISVIQDSTIHDSPQFSGCYDRSANTVKKYLNKYPSIKVVIDVHRDSVNYDDGTKVKPTVMINGKKAAQVMLVCGCNTGLVEGFLNWRENLRLSMRLQQTLEVMYPTLARSITFTARKYNLHLTKGSLLLEMGTEANTLKEAEYSALLVSNALVHLLNNL